MKGISYLDVLNHPPNMLCIVQKLPMYLQYKWREQVSRARQSNNTALNYEALVAFISFAADTANDPVYGGLSAQKDSTRDRNKQFSKTPTCRGKQNSFAVNVSSQDKNILSISTCPLCQQCHDLDSCKQYLHMTIDARRLFLKSNKLCFACYGTNHISKGCTHKRRCNTCGKPHPTGLHVDGFVLKRKSTMNDGQVDSHPQMPPSLRKQRKIQQVQRAMQLTKVRTTSNRVLA